MEASIYYAPDHDNNSVTALASSPAKEAFFGRRKREKQPLGLIGNRTESIAAVKGDCRLVLGVNYKRESGRRRLHRASSSVHQKQLSQPAPLKSLVHGKAADENSWQGGITR